MRATVTLSIILLTVILNPIASGKTPTPDFAYPEKVARQAENDLNQSLSEGNGEKVADALIRYGLARTSVSNDNFAEVIAKVSDVISNEKSVPTRSILNMLLADIYAAYYNMDSYNLDRRTTVASTTDDFTLWSGEQFKAKITELCDSALANSDVLKTVALSDYPDLIAIDKESRPFYPTLFDFASYHTMQQLSRLSRPVAILARSWLVRTLGAPPSGLKAANRHIIEIADRWIDSHPEASPAKVAAELARFDYVSGCIAPYLDDDNDPEAGVRNALIKMYRTDASTPASVEFLLRIAPSDNMEANRQLYRLCEDYKKKNPTYFRIGAVDQLMEQLKWRQIQISYPGQIARGVPFEITIKASNVKTGKITIYRVPDKIAGTKVRSTDISRLDKVGEENFEFSGDIPFSDSRTIKTSVGDFGRYIFVPESPGVKVQNNFPVTVCSDMSAIACGNGESNMFFTVDAMTGTPVSDVSVTLRSANKKDQNTIRGISDNDGHCKLNITDRSSWLISLAKGEDKYMTDLAYYNYRYGSSAASDYAIIQTSLPVYHPGDSVDFVAVIYSATDEGAILRSDTDISAILYDVNSTEIATSDLKTDSTGRTAGRFGLPSTDLTGNFHIAVKWGDEYLGNCFFLVSDYKLPTYEVTVMVKNGGADTKDIVIDGQATTYSGFPVTNAKVTTTLSNFGYSSWGWNRSTSVEFVSIETTTDSNGAYCIEIPEEMLSDAPYPEGGVVAEVLVTSASGENRTGSVTFPLGRPYGISANLRKNIDASVTHKLNIGLYDITGTAIDGSLDLCFRSDSLSYNISATTSGGVTDVDLSSIPSGEYDIVIADNGKKATDMIEKGVVIYRPTDIECPVESPLWVPLNSYTVSPGAKSVEILYATANDGLNMLVSTGAPGKDPATGWVKVNKGMHRLKVDLPHGDQRTKIVLATVNGLKYVEHEISVTVQDPADRLKITVENFRDRIIPQSDGKITLQITDGTGKGVQSAIILDMYSKSIDAIARTSWRFAPVKIGIPSFNQTSFSYSTKRILYLSSVMPSYRYPDLGTPGFNLYGHLFGTRGIMYMRGARTSSKFKMASPMAAADGIDEYYSAELAIVEHMEKVAVDEAETAGYSDTTVSRNDNESQDSGDTGDFEYRPSEIPLAFFAPMLTTDADGNLTYNFEVPNANTTWMLNILAYDTRMNSAINILETVASKPVMVSPNLPRFLRQGDRATIAASVMNNTDSAASVTTVFEVIDPATMAVLVSESAISQINGNGSVTELFDIVTGLGKDALIVRIKSTAGNYTDGEQLLLPILASEQTVTDSHTFYLSPDTTNYSVDLPDGESDRSITVSYCGNPTWEVVTALPGLQKDGSRTSTDAAASLFSAAVATGLLHDNPDITRSLESWLESARDNDTMLSMLNRNEDLKQFMLTSTPWVSSAADDSERMTRLALLFDKKSTAAAIESAIETLEKYETADGGWAWNGYFDEPSEWVTVRILDLLGQLKDLGYLPGDNRLSDMTERAIAWLDRTVATRYAKYPKSDFSTYTYIRSFFPETGMSSGARSVYNATIQRTIGIWKEQGTAAKAQSAIILYRAGYKNVAGTILSSLREFASESSEQGMWWDSVDAGSWWSLSRNGQTAMILDAFRIIDPDCAEIDKIRQWLILNKQVQDWGNSINASECIAAILRCGSSWLNRPDDTTIHIDGKSLNLSQSDRLTGAIVENIDTKASVMTIDRSQSGPAWGAIMVRYTGMMSQIGSSSMPDLSISKDLSVKRGGEWVTTDSLAVGDIAKVRIVLTAARDMDYVTVIDQRAASLEPVVQTPREVYCDGAYFYLENRDAVTNLFIDHLNKGMYIIEYEMNVNNAGSYSSGVATVQSQYTPEMTAHSAGSQITVE